MNLRTLFLLSLVVFSFNTINRISLCYSASFPSDSLNSDQRVYFDFGTYDLKPQSIELLDKLAEELKNNPEAKIEVTGYTDNIGSEGFNIELSVKRAESVKGYLISKGVLPEMITVKGEGFNNPAADNINDDNRALNRRAELKVTNYKMPAEEKNESFVNASLSKYSRDTLNLNVSLRDTSGEPVTEVTENDINAILKWDNGSGQDSSKGEPRLIPIDEQKKIAFTFTMDYSASMYNGSFEPNAKKTEQITGMEKAVNTFITNMDNRHFAKFIKFGRNIDVIQGFTKSRELMFKAIQNGSYPREGTALYKSVYSALMDPSYDSNPSIIKTVIAFTDGEENSSGNISKDSVYRLSELSGIKVYTVGLINSQSHSVPVGMNSKAESDLVEIAQKTGGFYYWATDPVVLQIIYRQIYDQIMKSYRLSIIWDNAKLPPKGTQVTAILRFNIKGINRTIYKKYIME